MDASKILMIVCTAILSVTLILSLVILDGVKTTMKESEAVNQEVAILVDQLYDRFVEQSEENLEDIPTSGEEDANQDTPDGGFWIRATNGKIGVYTVEGTLIRVLDVLLDSMPEMTREDLKTGVWVGSMRELIEQISDYTS